VDYQIGRNGWGIIHQPLGFLIFIVCAFAECNRAPFDMPECETELVGGYHTEFSSMKLGFYLFAEYINMFISSAVIATLYFGGYHVPGLDRLGLDPNLVTVLGVGHVRQDLLLHLLLHVGALVHPALPVRPADEPRLEGLDPAGHPQHGADRWHVLRHQRLSEMSATRCSP
jgi:NADH:ubiquinone oxidoreductase subunit H